MAAFVHAPIVRPYQSSFTSALRKPVDSERLTAGKPIPIICDRISRDFERGLSFRSLGKRYVGIGVEVLESVLRDRLRSLESAMRTAGVVVAAMLGLAVGLEAIEAAMGTGAPVERAFRTRSRRSRRGRNESAVCEMAEFSQVMARAGFGMVA